MTCGALPAVVRARDLSDGTAARLRRSGRMLPLLPGILVDPDRADALAVRMLAVWLWKPAAVICGAASAAVTFWPELAVQTICVAIPTGIERPGFCFHRRRLRPGVIRPWQRGWITTSAVTTLDLVDEYGADPIDRCLRARAATLDQLWEALRLMSGRSGNQERRRLLIDSRGEPWSAAERLAHRLLRAAGIRGWIANYRVVLGGLVSYIDIAFPSLKLAVEIDGRFHWMDEQQHRADQVRQNRLVLGGWMVLRFTWHQLTKEPELVVAQLRRAIARQNRQVRTAGG